MPVNAERQAKAKEYARIKRRLFLLDMVITGLLLVVVLLSGIAVWARNLVLSISADPWLSTLLFFVLGSLGYLALSSPLSYYSGYVLPHRYGLSTQDLRGWLIDQLKGGAASLVLGALVLEVVYWLLRAAPDTWWLWAS